MMKTLCVSVGSGNYLIASIYDESMPCNNVLITHTEYVGLNNNFNLQFDINKELYSEITFYLLLSFLGGHVLGRITKALGRYV